MTGGGAVVVGSEVLEAGLFGSVGVGLKVPGCVVGLGSMDGLPGTVGTVGEGAGVVDGVGGVRMIARGRRGGAG